MTCAKTTRRKKTTSVSSAEDLKATFRARWSRPDRVTGWIDSGLNADFADESCRLAWKGALQRAVTGSPLRTALDLGTGHGTIAQFWAELNARTIGIDFAHPMLTAAKQRAAAKNLAITFLEGDAEAPPFRNKRFDVISSRFLLFTLPHPGYAMRRWVELLSPGGHIVLVGHERPEDAGRSPNRRSAAPAVRPSAFDKRHQEALRLLPFVDHTPGDLRVVMEAVGLKNIQRIPLDDLIAARAALQKRRHLLAIAPSTPFILSGEK